jgi:hypothetical protein
LIFPVQIRQKLEKIGNVAKEQRLVSAVSFSGSPQERFISELSEALPAITKPQGNTPICLDGGGHYAAYTGQDRRLRFGADDVSVHHAFVRYENRGVRN